MAVLKQSLAHGVAIVEADGRPTPEFQRAWQRLSGVASTGGTAPDTYVRKGQAPGWTSATGTASRAAFATYAAPTISNPPTQAQVQAIAAHLQILSQHVKALIDDAKTVQLLTA